MMGQGGGMPGMMPGAMPGGGRPTADMMASMDPKMMEQALGMMRSMDPKAMADMLVSAGMAK